MSHDIAAKADASVGFRSLSQAVALCRDNRQPQISKFDRLLAGLAHSDAR
jgi:hypothetical protein